jgi:hypothetical protein
MKVFLGIPVSSHERIVIKSQAWSHSLYLCVPMWGVIELGHEVLPSTCAMLFRLSPSKIELKKPFFHHRHPSSFIYYGNEEQSKTRAKRQNEQECKQG